MPFGAIAYIHIDGEVPGPVDHTATVAQQLGEFLQALWQVPPETYSGLGLPIVADPFIGLRALRDATMPGVARHLEPIELATVERWWAEVLADRWLAMPFRPTLVHGDLWWGNLLVRGEHPHLAAILDWESVHLGDIARDIATQMHAGVEFARTVVRHTGLGMESIILRARAQRYWEAREFEGISWSIEQGDDDELAESIAKLRAGPILNPGAPGLASLPGHAGVDSQHGAC
jgi:aminoglycoside phosphotransferase (APT) family kinase protein